MSMIEWDGSLAIGHELIDEHHKKFVDIINELHAARVAQTEHLDLRLILVQLRRYTEYHFEVEEFLLAKLDKKHQDSHVQEHQSFIETLSHLTDKFNAGDVHIGTEIFMWLVGCLLEHISVTDRQLINCLSKYT